VETTAGRSGAEELACPVPMPTRPRASSASSSGKAIVRKSHAPCFAVPFILVLLLNIINLLFLTMSNNDVFLIYFKI
jgi:hypothetical protein